MRASTEGTRFKTPHHETTDFRGKRLAKLPEFSGLFVLPDIVPVKVLSIHRNINAVRECLNKRHSAAEIEQPVRAPEFVRDHRSGQDNCLLPNRPAEHSGSDLHGIGPVRNHNLVFCCLQTMINDDLPVLVGHLETVDHHEGAEIYLEFAPSQLKHLVEVRVFEKELSVEFIVLFVECPTCDKDPDSHTIPSFDLMNVVKKQAKFTIFVLQLLRESVELLAHRQSIVEFTFGSGRGG
jgi:hypothetical protein